jgi:hypothetical protein
LEPPADVLAAERDASELESACAPIAIHLGCPAIGLLRGAIARLGPEVVTRRSGLKPSTIASYLARRRRPNADSMFALLDAKGVAIPLEDWRPFAK